MFKFRRVIVCIIAAATSACATPHRSPQTLVYLAANANSPASIFVDDEKVAMPELADSTLNRVFADNPQMLVRDIYVDAQVVVCSESHVLWRDTAAVVERLTMEGFQNIRVAIAGSDCSTRGN